jgi:hypothetical protein
MAKTGLNITKVELSNGIRLALQLVRERFLYETGNELQKLR